MSYDFNADEILKMAEQIEKNGAKFYRDAAQNVSDPAHKQTLGDLAAMEDEHEKTFASMRVDLSKTEKIGTTFDPEDEAAQYLGALADTRVFFEKDIDLTSMKEILKAAIIAEKDSIVFYLGMKNLVPGKLGKERLDQIIQEEMGHIKVLGQKLKAL